MGLCEEELESTVVELEKSNRELAILKAGKAATKVTFFPILNLSNNAVTSDKGDKQKDLQDMESALKDLLVIDCISFCLMGDVGQLVNCN